MPESESQIGAPQPPNADQIAYWNGDAGARWAALQPRIDVLLTQLTQSALACARPQAGERVVDVGCGCGSTVLELARRVGAGGSVTGIDISEPMLAVAAERVHARHLDNVTLLRADASQHPFEPEATDLIFSQFGVMFFNNPAGAFANMRRALRRSGRLVFICWRQFVENPCFLVPFEAARPFFSPQPPTDPHAPGPFAFADPERVRRILEEAGFSSIEIDRHDPMACLGGPDELDTAAELAVRVGPVARPLAEAGPEARAAAQGAILEALKPHLGPQGIYLPASIWRVSARP
jgi:SAM-dependent methyltransferase